MNSSSSEPDLEVVFDERESSQAPVAADLTSDAGQSQSQKQTLRDKKSDVWHFFDESESGDKKYAICKLCQTKISRQQQSTTKSKSGSSTTPMRNHLRMKHHKEYTLHQSKSKDKPSTPSSSMVPRQPQLTEIVKNMVQWEITDPRAIELHKLIAEMIAIDNEPFRLVEREGFLRLMRKVTPKYNVPGRTYFSTNIVPDIFQKCRKSIQRLVDSASHISMTSDIWTCNHNNEPFISLTAHFIDENFVQHRPVLNSAHFPGSHNYETISEMLIKLLAEWNIKIDRMHLLLRDNAGNMIKGVDYANIPSESCFLHTLQLSILDSINKQKGVNNTLAICRKLVGHFSHSSLACSKLKKIQTDLGINTNKLVQDVSTRWNSTFYMLQSILEQKRSLIIYSSEHCNEIAAITDSQWSQVAGLLALLKPFEEITKMVSESNSAISEVIPAVATLKRYLQKENKELHCAVGTIKDALLKSICGRFDQTCENPNYYVATFLDPRFKHKLFPEGKYDSVKDYIFQEMCKINPIADLETDDRPVTSEIPETSILKKSHTAYWDCFDELISQGSSQSSSLTSTVVNKPSSISARQFQRDENLQSDIKLYESMGVLSRKLCPFLWWKTNKSVFPNLSKLARKFLSAPASSVYSERLFSEAGTIYEDTRNRLLPRNGEMLAFLNYNLKILHFSY